jgi:hypothetical protein
VKTRKSWGQKIYIEWRDATSSSWQTTEEALKKDDEQLCYTNGFFVGEDKDNIVVACTRGKTKDNLIGGVWRIPKNWIIKVK